jgi:hypothetical protein
MFKPALAPAGLSCTIQPRGVIDLAAGNEVVANLNHSKQM